jgi:cytochrome c oxidase cbb3-type subunit 1
MGWALPIALAGVILYFRNLPAGREGRLGLATRVDPTDILPDGRVPDVLSTWLIVLWNLAVLVVGVGFLYQNQAWSAWLFAPGYTALLVLWLYELTVAVRLRWAVRAREPEASQPTP